MISRYEGRDGRTEHSWEMLGIFGGNWCTSVKRREIDG